MSPSLVIPLVCVVQAVEEYIQAQQVADVEEAPPVRRPTLPMAAAGAPTAPVHIVSSGSFHGSQSIAHGSYQEAFASSLRSHGYSFDG